MVLQEARRGMYDIVSGSEYYIYGTYIYIYIYIYICAYDPKTVHSFCLVFKHCTTIF